MFVQKTTTIRQSNTSASFFGFGEAIELGALNTDPQSAPRDIPAGTEIAIVAKVATADHFNLFLVACKLPDGSVKGLALRPKPLAKLEAILGPVPPAPETPEDTGEETPSEPVAEEPKAEPKAKKPRKSRAKKAPKAEAPAPVIDLDDIEVDEDDEDEGPSLQDLEDIEAGF